MTATPADSTELDYRPSYRAASIVAALIFILYLITLSPTTAMWDTSEYIVAAYTLGLPHPPGNPFFVLIGRVFALLPIAPNVAMRINILAALCSAAAAGFWFLITERVLEAFRNFVRTKPDLQVQPAQIDEDLDFARLRLRQEIITAPAPGTAR